jgi:hypothetical protein
MLRDDLRLAPEDVRRLGVIVNIGLVGSHWPPQRRFLTINYVRPEGGDDQPHGVSLAPLATWDASSDTFTPATPEVMAELATLLEMTPDELEAALRRRIERLDALAAGRGVGLQAMRQSVDELYIAEHGLPPRLANATARSDEDDEDDEDDE